MWDEGIQMARTAYARDAVNGPADRADRDLGAR